MNQMLSMEEQDPPKQDDIKQIELLTDPAEKLQACIVFMRNALAQKGMANFKGFWEVRKLCLPLFKVPLTAPIRAQAWAEYMELTREGRRLKNILDQESAFASEQIELAIASLEKEVVSFHDDPESVLNGVADVLLPEGSETLKKRRSHYQYVQKKLNVLNVFAARINSLRKELIRTEMRIRQKNQFFSRLSQLGDRVFPLRKELIREVSETFVHDVTRFYEDYFEGERFSPENARHAVFFFREEIKILQSAAKILTLNTNAFSQGRHLLSQCWDKLKGMEKELKKEYAQVKQKSGENSEQVRERIRAFAAGYAEGKYSVESGMNELDAISRWMREIDLTRQDVYALKDELARAREPLEAVKMKAEEQRREAQEQFEKARQGKVEALKREVEALAVKAASGPVGELLKQLDEYRKTCSALSMLKAERTQLDRRLKAIRDQLAEREEQTLLDLSADDLATLEGLENVLGQRKERRKQSKAQLEEFRKVSGGSSLDFEKAIRLQEQMQEEKERLAKIDEGIAEIENKIRSLKKKG